jgi:hypothetical protein
MIVQSHDESLFQMLLNDLELEFNFDPEKPTILIHERYIFTSSNQGLRVVICDTREEQSAFLRTALCQFSEIGSAVLMENLQNDLAERSSV